MKIGVRTKSISGVVFLLIAGTVIVGVRSTKLPTDAIPSITETIDISNKPYLSFDNKDHVHYGFVNSSGQWQSTETDTGKIVILYFWSTWCQPCEEMTGWLNRFWYQYKNFDLVMTAIALDTEIETIQRTIRAQKNDIPYVFLSKNIITDAKFINGAPLILVLSEKGKILKKYEGVIDEAEFSRDLIQWIEKK